MSNDSGPMTCDGLAEQLARYLEDELPETARAALDAHAASCALCDSLLADLDAIRREAAALPPLEPSRDLWAGIAARIAAPVVPLERARRPRAASRRAWVLPSMAAAALVLITAGVTHVLTRASYAPDTAGVAAPAVGREVAQVAPDAPASPPARSAPDGEFTSTATARSAGEATMSRPANGRSATTPAARLVSAEPLMKEAQPTYDREIDKLRAIVTERRAQLDPRTIAVLDQSIAVIDSAIAQSRAALAKDPASGFLATQLNHSLDKKVELLRTAALLPSRT